MTRSEGDDDRRLEGDFLMPSVGRQGGRSAMAPLTSFAQAANGPNHFTISAAGALYFHRPTYIGGVIVTADNGADRLADGSGSAISCDDASFSRASCRYARFVFNELAVIRRRTTAKRLFPARLERPLSDSTTHDKDQRVRCPSEAISDASL